MMNILWRTKLGVLPLFFSMLLLLAATSAHAATLTANYTYDSIGRLISTSYTNAANSGAISYNYDAAGNLLASTVTGAPAGGNQPPAPTAPAITTAAGTAGTSQIAANDPNTGDTHTYAVTTTPTNGTATVNASGLATYTPNTGFSGADSFVVTVTDNGTPQQSGTVTISVTVASSTTTVTSPTITSVSPTTATVGVAQDYTITGSNLPASIVGNIQGSVSHCTYVSGSGNSVVLNCIADVAGNQRFYLKEVSGANQPVISGSANLLINVAAAGASGTATTLNNGLVAHYKFDGDALDSSGNGNNGTVFGGASYVQGVLGQGIKLNGVNSAGGTANPDYVMVPNSQSLQFTTAMTVSYWVRIDGNMSQTSADCSGASITGAHGATVAKRGDRFGFTFDEYDLGSSFSINPWSGGQGLSASNLTTSLQNFRHMTYVINGQTISMYADGVLIKSATGIVDFATANLQDLYLGVAQNLNGACLKFWYPLDGVLDDVRIYNRALSASEVTALASGSVTSQPSSTIITTASHTLQSGWNLVGWSVADTAYSTPSSFAQLIAVKGGKVSSIWNFVGGVGNPWQNWNGQIPAASDPNFTSLVAGKGYWVQMARLAPGNYVSVTLHGVAAPAISSLKPGWNLVAGEANVNDGTAVGGLLTQLGGSSMWTMQYGSWQSFLMGSPSFLNSLQSVVPEKGYYIFK